MSVIKLFHWGRELTLSQSAGLCDLSVVEQADAARQRPERHHASVVFNLAAGTALQNWKHEGCRNTIAGTDLESCADAATVPLNLYPALNAAFNEKWAFHFGICFTMRSHTLCCMCVSSAVFHAASLPHIYSVIMHGCKTLWGFTLLQCSD